MLLPPYCGVPGCDSWKLAVETPLKMDTSSCSKKPLRSSLIRLLTIRLSSLSSRAKYSNACGTDQVGGTHGTDQGGSTHEVGDGTEGAAHDEPTSRGGEG
jgi:hypothetical protein